MPTTTTQIRDFLRRTVDDYRAGLSGAEALERIDHFLRQTERSNANR